MINKIVFFFSVYSNPRSSAKIRTTLGRCGAAKAVRVANNRANRERMGVRGNYGARVPKGKDGNGVRPH